MALRRCPSHLMNIINAASTNSQSRDGRSPLRSSQKAGLPPYCRPKMECVQMYKHLLRSSHAPLRPGQSSSKLMLANPVCLEPVEGRSFFENSNEDIRHWLKAARQADEVRASSGQIFLRRLQRKMSAWITIFVRYRTSPDRKRLILQVQNGRRRSNNPDYCIKKSCCAQTAATPSYNQVVVQQLTFEGADFGPSQYSQ
jgi:hypothetical protein